MGDHGKENGDEEDEQHRFGRKDEHAHCVTSWRAQ